MWRRITCESGQRQCVAQLATPNAGCRRPRARTPARQFDQISQGKRDMQQQQPTVTRTDYTGGEELTIYVDSFLKGQVVAAALIGECHSMPP